MGQNFSQYLTGLIFRYVYLIGCGNHGKRPAQVLLWILFSRAVRYQPIFDLPSMMLPVSVASSTSRTEVAQIPIRETVSLPQGKLQTDGQYRG